MSRWKFTAQVSMVLTLSFLVGCVAQVRDTRTQEPLYQIDEQQVEEHVEQDELEEIEVALVDVQIAQWVEDDIPEGDEPDRLLESAIPAAFDGTNYSVVDRTDVDADIVFGPDTEPQILQSASRTALLGRPYPYDYNDRAEAYGHPPVSWEVVSGPPGFNIDSETGEVNWVPQREGEISITLEAQNELGEERYNFSVYVQDDDEVEINPRTPGDPNIDGDQDFATLLDDDVIEQVDEPLVLAAHVVSWRDWEERTRDDTTLDDFHRHVETDVVYSLWTVDGEEIETRRVTLQTDPNNNYDQAPSMAPSWSQTWVNNWAQDDDYVPFSATSDQDALMEEAARVNAKGFAYPYGYRQVQFSHQLADEDGLEQGLELVDQEDWEAAYEEFASVAEQDPDNHGAWFNMGVMQEMLGDSDRAIGYYQEAVALEDEGMYSRRLDYLTRHADSYVDITDEIVSAKQALQQPAVADEQPADDELDEEVDEDPDTVDTEDEADEQIAEDEEVAEEQPAEDAE